MMVDKSNDNPFADDSDDEDEKPSKKKSASKKSTDEYAGSIRVKEGRNTNNTLYYVDHSKLQNNGNGLLPEARNELFSALETSKQELAVLGQKHKKICSDTAQLLSEPKNEELETELQELTNKMEVVDNGLEEARAHASSKFVLCLSCFCLVECSQCSPYLRMTLSTRRCKACEAIERPHRQDGSRMAQEEAHVPRIRPEYGRGHRWNDLAQKVLLR